MTETKEQNFIIINVEEIYINKDTFIPFQCDKIPYTIAEIANNKTHQKELEKCYFSPENKDSYRYQTYFRSLKQFDERMYIYEGIERDESYSKTIQSEEYKDYWKRFSGSSFPLVDKFSIKEESKEELFKKVTYYSQDIFRVTTPLNFPGFIKNRMLNPILE